MDNNKDSAITFPSNQLGVLQGRQVAILAKIEALTQSAPSEISINRSTIAFLKQEYNEIVEKLDDLDRSPLVDPLEALPADIWPNIFEKLLAYFDDPVEELLNLTLVSRAWLVALTSLAELWTKIWLDLSKADYLAKALVAIHLSGSREIELHFGVMTLDEWRKISSRITPASGRIRYLRFPETDIVTPGKFEILRDLKDLPVLRDIVLHHGRMIGNDYLHDEQMERMPSLKTFKGIEFSEGSRWNRFILDHRLDVDAIRGCDIDSLASLSNLKTLKVMDSGQYETEKENHQKQSFSPIDSVEEFTYRGQNLLRSLMWIGDNLTTLSFPLQRHIGIDAVLLAISRFRRLQQLEIGNHKSFATSSLKGASNVAAFELSVKEIILSEYGIDDTRALWDYIFRALMPCSLRLETLFISGITINESVRTYISTRRQLISLRIALCQIDGPKSHVSLDAITIRHIQWLGCDDDTDIFLASFQNPAVRRLHLTTRLLPFAGVPRNDREARIPELKNYGVATHAFPNITSLVVTVRVSTNCIWELRSFSLLKELEIQHYSVIPYGRDSEVLDTILLRPIDAPALEKITIRGIFCEWDILILMLERRNLLGKPGVAPIKTIVLETELPYKLLHPVSELLGGKFVERDSNGSFSIEAIGERVLNKSRTGCKRCCFTFNECGVQPTPSGYKSFRLESTQLTQEHLLPSEYMIPDPPLPVEVERWLAGKRARREAFLQVYDETANKFHREQPCVKSKPQRDFILNKYSLAGVLCEQKDTLASDEAY